MHHLKRDFKTCVLLIAAISRLAVADTADDLTLSNARLIPITGSNAVMAVWAPPSVPGSIENRLPLYATSLDGTHFTEPRPTSYTIKLRRAGFDPLTGQPQVPELLRQKMTAAGVGQQAALSIVQFIAPPNEAMLDQLRQLGAKPRTYLPMNAYVVEMTSAMRDLSATLPTVRWVGPYHVAYRLEESLVAELSAAPSKRSSAGVDLKSIPTRRYSIMLFERGPAVQQVVANRIAELGGVVNARIKEGFRLEATLTAAQLLEVAAMNQVQFIDRWGPAGTDMDIARQIGGATPLLSNLGFTGQGVRGEVMDDGILQTHIAFQLPAPVIHGVPPNVMPHGTSTYGIVFGNGEANAAGTGLLPNREQGIFARYTQLAGQGGIVSRYTHTSELVDPLGQYRAVFQSNSWGSASNTQYTTVSAELDDILFIYDVILCQSQSNNNSTLSRPEAWAKNAISVGGVNHFDTLTRLDDTWSGASFGPAADGRVKPDLTHFYDNVLCPTSGDNSAYNSFFNGTSAATPIVCGYFGLLTQMWHQQVFTGFGGAATVFDSRPHMATAKAMMINSAYKYNWLAGGFNGNITRAKQGWGMPDLARLYRDRNQTFIINESDPILPAQVKTYTIQVPAGASELRATLVYRDPKGNPAASQALVNDLSLKVTAPNNTFFWGNNGLKTANVSSPGGTADTIDNVENVFVSNPAAGTWTVRVYGDAIVQDGNPSTPGLDAVFALVVASRKFCAGDANEDQVVNVSDLLMVINSWGACPGCPADVTGDGIVNASDLLAVINAWGPCP